MNFPLLEVPEYCASPVVASRVGRILADAAPQVPIRPMGTWS
jgi:hypothetical protein